MSSLKELNDRFAIPGVARLEQGPQGFIRLAVTGPQAEGHVYLYGAHVSHYQPRGQRPVLFMSRQAVFQPGKALRGGVPVIFPWFGPRAGHPQSPMHGFVRTVEWSLQSVSQEADGAVSVGLGLMPSEAMKATWPHEFALRFTARFGVSLEMALEVRNTSGEPFTFEEALHTYFAVADVREATVAGLAGATYSDKTDNYNRKKQDQELIRFAGEVDRMYLNTSAATVLDDLKGGRKVTVDKAASKTTVVWNPYVAKAKAMADFGDNEWTEMLCIETCNASDNAVSLAPGQAHVMKAIIRSQAR